MNAELTTQTTADSSAMGYLMRTVLSTLLTLVVLSPVAYVVHRNRPPRIVTVNVQALLEEHQQRTMLMTNHVGEMLDENRTVTQQLTMDFAKKFSSSVERLAQECHCVIVNKAALLGGVGIDYTDQVRARMNG